MVVLLVVSLIIFIGDGVPFGLMVILAVLFGGLVVGGTHFAVRRERRLASLAHERGRVRTRRRRREGRAV